MKLKIILSSFFLLVFLSNINAQVKKEIKPGKNFTQVNLEGSGTVYLEKADTFKLIIETSSNDVIDYINIDVKGDELVINTTSKNKNVCKSFAKTTFYVYYNSLNKVHLEGAGKIISKDTIKADIFNANLDGSGTIDLMLNSNFLRSELEGAGTVIIKGKTQESIIRLSGVGTFKMLDFVSEKVDVSIEGVGSAYINATKYIKGEMSGIGSIIYKGNPKTVDFDKCGLGKIKKYKN
jgi:hypothetical protein